MSYDAYERFLEAAKKFPRWSNIRRRPIESNGGKILRSIIEEIAAVEDAIIEYKKDFFIVNYIGREDTILDYLYIAHVGDIENIENLVLQNPALNVTDDEAVFYQSDLALYKDGYIVMKVTNDENKLTYSYNDYIYYADIIKQSVWNIIDEFAWWCGLERFDGEYNASLLQRCISQFRDKPNSSEEGIRNAIVNAAKAKVDLLDSGRDVVPVLEKEEVKFLAPDEETLSLKNEEGISLYEEISRFNRDIARTRKWDMDYWDNAFRELHYLPHVWDAEVDTYQNGVGYHDALKVTTIKNIDTDSFTDISIFGYVPSVANIEAYIREQNIRQNIPLQFRRYNDIINPVKVQYRITAEDLIPVTELDQIIFSFYKQSREGYYDIDRFMYNREDTVVTSNNSLTPNTSYRLIFTPGQNIGETMMISHCDLISGDTKNSLLEEQGDFKYDGTGIRNKAILFHGDKIADFIDPENLEDRIDTGFSLINPMQDAVCYVNLRDWCTELPQLLDIEIDPDSGWQDVTSSIIYVTPDEYVYDAGKSCYISPLDTDSTFMLHFPAGACRDLTMDLTSAVETEEQVVVDIIVAIDGIENETLSVYRKQVENGYTFSFSQDDIEHDVVVTVIRRDEHPITISRIRRRSYTIGLTAGNETIPYYGQSQMSIPVTTEGAYLTCRIHNGQNPISPVIRSIHIGPRLRNIKYILDFETNNAGTYALDIQTNCNVTLLNLTTEEIQENYTTHNTYTADEYGTDILLDLSSFDRIDQTIPAVKKAGAYGDRIYSLHLAAGQSIQQIWIRGMGYLADENRQMRLSDIISLEPGETLYFAKSFKAMIAKSDIGSRLIRIAQDDLPSCDRITVTNPEDPYLMASFETAFSHVANTYTGAYDYMYLYDASAKEYIAYNTTNLVKYKTENIEIIPSFSPTPKDMAKLSYKISEIIPDNGISVYFSGEERRDWSVDSVPLLTVEVDAFQMGQPNTEIFSTDTISTNQNIQLSNVIEFQDLITDPELLTDLGEYDITPPDTMEIVYRTATYSQDAMADGAALYVEEDGFNKLRHANITKIDKIRIDGITYDTAAAIDQILSLMQEEGIICWKDASLVGKRIEWVNYTYKEPVSLRFKDVSSLYKVSGYKTQTQDCVNQEEYIIKNLADGDTVSIDAGYFTQMPETIAVVCSNPCYHATVADGVIRVSKIAEDNSPVIHNGYYYIDGLEYYFFANRYEDDINRLGGLTIENGKIIGNVLYLQKEAVNHLQNSKMECNKLDIHCIVDFTRPRIKTNIDPVGQIGACESYSAWEDCGVSRALVVYKNGYATRFTMQPDGYILLDITPFLCNHTTVSCLYDGNLSFFLAKEIRILGEQALKTVYCEPVKKFDTYQDIAYTIMQDLDLDHYRYYLVVKGNGVLDEVMIHDLTDEEKIAEHHIKAIDKLGLLTTEQNHNTGTHVQLVYDSSFMKYNHLETDTDTSLRVGTTIDWNITKLHSYDLSECKKTGFLSRNNGLIAQIDKAVLETNPFEIRYQRSIHKMAVKVNDYIDDIQKGFTIIAYGSSAKNGTYTKIGQAYDTNQFEFEVRASDRYLKFQIEAAENKKIASIDLLAIYKETPAESLGIFYYTDGSAVTKVFNIGAVGNYRFSSIQCEDGFDEYYDVYIRGAKQTTDGEYVWTTWQNTEAHPVFNGYELFQFKIRMQGQDNRLRIKAFEFEVL